jgi:DNA-binding NarL/FixJ family response regulator
MNWKFWKSTTPALKERNLDEIKSICRILFIDDKAFPLIDILKTAGWIGTKRIKDADSLEQIEIREAHILIVDIQGVGKKLKFKDEGLGLILALKSRYPNKKIIVYSAEDQGKIQAFHAGIDAADKRLSKNSDPYEFQVVIESYAKEAFSLAECVKRIQTQILAEFGSSLDTEKIIANLNKINNKEDYSIQNISKVFNLQNASNISSIIQLFLTAN